MPEALSQKVMEAAEFLRKRLPQNPPIGLILGTGLGDLAERVEQPTIIPYADIPHFPESTVKFHAGRLVAGVLRGKHVLVMQGRFHYYEGYPLQQITLPVRVMAYLGINTLFVTNAAGGIRPHLAPGTLALITDHLNLMGNNPLIGSYEEFLGERFPDMSEPYSFRLRKLALDAAKDVNIPLVENIYAAVSGPSFETQAEIRMLQTLGADSVGMSVVPEVLVAGQIGLEVLAITAITDQALSGSMQPITHEEVSRTAKEMTPRFIRLAEEIIARM
jgi:purine-nucleoside phosphorylase